MSNTVLILGNLLSSSVGTRSVGEELAERLMANGWGVIASSHQVQRLARLADMMLCALKHRHDYKVACIEVYSGTAFIWAEILSFLLKLLGKPIVLTLHGGNLPPFSRRYPRRVRRLLRAATVVTTPSSLIQSAFVDMRADIVLLRNAVDLSAYPFKHRPQPRPRLAWLRAFHAIYSPITAAQALARLTAQFPDIELAMFGPDKGDGSLGEMLAWAEAAQVRQRIHVRGAIPKTEVPQQLSQYDIFINTTTAESFGVSVVEAAALGMCIVTTDVGELPHIWTHDHDALLVPPNDAQAMAEAIARILTEPGLAERLSRNARATAEPFDWSLILPQWESLLRDVISRGAHG